MKRLLVGLVVVALLALGGVLAYRHYGGYIAASDSQFSRDTAPKSQLIAGEESAGKKSVINSDGTIKYLNDDFRGYEGVNQQAVTLFDSTKGVSARGANGPISLDHDSYQGNASVAVPITSNQAHQVTVTQKLASPADLSHWASRGYATAWLKLQDRTGISGVSLRLVDAQGNYRQYSALPNLQTNYPNTIENDPFPDLALPDAGETANWTDFWLNKGWNYLPWRADSGHYTDHGWVDMGSISSVQVIFTTTSQLKPQTISLNDLRMVDGLQQNDNEVGGNWYPPLAAPQYGVYDVTQKGSQASLKLLNIRQSQYPSNGDHGRLLSKDGTPLNFAMKVRFSANNLSGDTNDTYLRFLYDFDPSYDPGHDYFGAYMSLDYKKIGLLTVIPVQRFTVQTQEPLNNNVNASYRQNFKPKQNQLYELDMTVRGQHNVTTVYAVKGNRLKQVATLQYTFHRPREKQRNPIGFEVTGNAKATLYDVELLQL
jgi:hypothetical protein